MDWKTKLFDFLVVSFLVLFIGVSSGLLFFKKLVLEPIDTKIMLSENDSEREGWRLVRENRIKFPYSIFF